MNTLLFPRIRKHADAIPPYERLFHDDFGLENKAEWDYFSHRQNTTFVRWFSQEVTVVLAR